MENLILLNKTLEVEYRDPDKELWRSVLRQAFEDAFLPGKLHLCDYERREARDFVSKRSENFDAVCELAGLDASYVWNKLNQFRMRKEEGYVWKNDL